MTREEVQKFIEEKREKKRVQEEKEMERMRGYMVPRTAENVKEFWCKMDPKPRAIGEPEGYTWYCNRKSRFAEAGNRYKMVLLKNE